MTFLTLLLLLQAPHRAAPERTPTRVAIFEATPSRDVFLPWTCRGRFNEDAAKMLVECPDIISDKTAKYALWSPEDFEEGLPCSFALSADGKRSVVLAEARGDEHKTRGSYFVLFFQGEQLLKAQRIWGPWALRIEGRAFPPVLEQMAEGDAGFLYEYDHKSGLYRERPYPYPPDYEMGE
jgi:hypothetical protein